MKKRLSLFLAFALLFTASMPMFGVQAAALEGSGSKDSPWLIKSVDDLMAITESAYSGNGYKEFRLETNLTLPNNTLVPFLVGQFDGNGHTITVNYTSDTETQIGLFQEVKYYSGIRNLTVDGTITASADNASTGGFAGRSSGENTYVNCVNKANITNNGFQGGAGGILGIYTSGAVSFTNCVNEGTILGNNNETRTIEGISYPVNGGVSVGGIVGKRSNSALKEITNCKNVGKIQTIGYNGYAGGIIGDVRGATPITLCSNYGEISASTGSGFVGGIVGYADNINHIETSYNAGRVTNTDGSAGGILGSGNKATIPVTNCFNAGEVVSTKAGQKGYAIVYNNAAISNCYNVYPGLPLTSMASGGTNNYNILTVGIAAETGTTLLSAEAMKDSASYPSQWDFDTVWSEGNESYPYPQQRGNLVDRTIDLPEPELPDFTEGTGSAADPYIIKSAAEFKKIEKYPGSSFKLANNIDLTNVGYVPFAFIGNSLDGDNHIVKVAIESSKENTGLFSTASEVITIKNLIIEGSVSGTRHVGGLIGSSSVKSGSVIENCINKATITATSERVGGLIGSDYEGTSGRNFTYTGLINEGNVTASTYVGGIIGLTRQVVKNSKNIGSVSATGSVAGGIIGWAYGNGASNCYNTGAIEGNATVGGIIALYQGGAGNIENCYNTGSIKARSNGNTVFGGILGEMAAAGAARTLTLSNCYNIGETRNAFAFNPITTVATPGIETKPTYAGTIVENNCFYLSPEGEAASNGGASVPKTVAELKAGAALLGSAFEASTNSYEYPQLTGLLNTAASPVFHVVTVTADGEGTTTPNCPVYVADGKTLTVIPRASEGYIVKEIRFNGNSVPGVASYETPAITANSAVIVTFALPAPTEQIIPCPAAFQGMDGSNPMGIVFGTVKFAETNPIVEYGMLISSDAGIELDDYVLESGNAAVFAAKGEKINDAGQYGIKFIGSELAGKTYYTRAYAKYQNGTVLYGDKLVDIPAQ